jgi:peptide chain release factor subunit 1
MITQEQLQELLSYESQGKPVLSIYLDTDSTSEPIDTIKLRVRGMLKEAQLKQVEEVHAVEQYLDTSYDWSKPGLAMFANHDGTFFRAYPSAISFRNRVRTGPKPYVKPLAHLMDHYAHYGVILVDKVGARFFEYHLGELVVTEGFMGEEVQKVKKGRGSSTVGMRGGQGGGRHEDEVIQRNLRDAAQAAGHFFNNRPIRRLFLGGTAETTGQFKELLPKKLQSCLAGTFPIAMTANEHEVRQNTIELLAKANAEREGKLVEKMVGLHAGGSTAVIGLDDTLQAVSDKRVKTLIISDGYRAPGYIDDGSGFIVANIARSPLNEQELTEVEDVVDLAVSSTITQGGHVEIISDNPALEQSGRIGAILRY